MKTAISVPDVVFKEADRHARRTGRSRSQLYSQAVSEYLARHAPDAVTEKINEVCDALGEENVPSPFSRAVARQMLGKGAW